MASEYFFGVTLSASDKEHKWEPDELKENGSGDISLTPKGEHCLILKQAVLVGGKEGEVHVVEAETSGYKANIKLPVVAMVGGKAASTLLDLNFPDPPVHLRLIEGSGPIHIAGIHAIQTEQYNDEDDDDEDEDDYLEGASEEEEDEEEEAETEVKPKGKEDARGKKRTNSNSAKAQPSKKKKVANTSD